MPTDPSVDAYIADAATFAQPILTEIRARMHAIRPDFEEAIKWSMPFFVLNGRSFANMAAFKAHASFGLWRASEYGLSEGREGMGVLGKLTDVVQLPDAAAFAALVERALALSEARGKATAPRKPAKPEAEVPEALAEALARDELAAACFNAFPPSARRDYCEWIGEAKREETRAKRLAQAIEWLREGKRRHWQYEQC